jgi:hypothetical protein
MNRRAINKQNIKVEVLFVNDFSLLVDVAVGVVSTGPRSGTLFGLSIFFVLDINHLTKYALLSI